MQVLEYPVVIEKGEKGDFIVSFPDVPEAITFGMTLEDALYYALDALWTVLSWSQEENRDIPLPSPAKPGQHTVKIDLDTLNVETPAPAKNAPGKKRRG